MRDTTSMATPCFNLCGGSVREIMHADPRHSSGRDCQPVLPVKRFAWEHVPVTSIEHKISLIPPRRFQSALNLILSCYLQCVGGDIRQGDISTSVQRSLRKQTPIQRAFQRRLEIPQSARSCPICRWRPIGGRRRLPGLAQGAIRDTGCVGQH